MDEFTYVLFKKSKNASVCLCLCLKFKITGLFSVFSVLTVTSVDAQTR